MEVSYFKKYFDEPEGGFFGEIYKFNPNDITILDIKHTMNGTITIKFGFMGSKGVRETVPGDTEPTHFSLKITFFGEIICSEITKSDNIENIKEMDNLKLKITKKIFSNTKKITLFDENSSKDIITIKCKKISFKDNHFDEYATDRNGNLVPYNEK